MSSLALVTGASSGIGRGGSVTLFIDGKAAGSGKVARTHPMYFSFDEGLDVGTDTGMRHQ